MVFEEIHRSAMVRTPVPLLFVLTWFDKDLTRYV